jgi:hypothetical protein
MGVKLGSLRVREEHRLRVFGNRVLRETLVFMRDNVAGEWGRINEFFELCYIRNIFGCPNQ